MSHIIISTIISHLIPILEEEFEKIEPKLQDELMSAVQGLVVKAESWIASKLEKGK